MRKEIHTISQMLARNVADFPHRPALVSPSSRSRCWIRNSWTEIDGVSDGLAAGLSSVGVRKGMKVAFMNANSAECYHCYLAIHKLGAVFVPINTRLVAREIESLMDHSDAEFLIIGSEFYHVLKTVLPGFKKIRRVVCIEKEGETFTDGTIAYSHLMETEGGFPAPDTGPDDEADLLYTSGTTGRPKGVLLTQANKVACGRMLGAAWGIHRKHYHQTILQNAYPFFTSTGVSSILMPWLYYGITVVLEPKFDVDQALSTIEKEKSTMYCGTPSMLIFILDHPRLRQLDLSSLQRIYSGGSTMPAELIQRLKAVWPDIRIYNVYGLTEGGTGGTCLDAVDIVKKAGSIGLPWPPDQEVRVVDEEGRDVETRAVGEILMRGPNIMSAYYKNPEATAEALQGGWLHTGDMGYYDEDGYFYFSDRKKDIIVRGGFNVYSVEVENALYEHPAVKQCAVVAKPHPKLGEDVLAFVVLSENKRVTAEELMDFCKDRIADYKRPRDIRFLDSLPLNAMGKIDKKALRGNAF